MADFMIRFLISSLFLCGVILFLLLFRHIFRRVLSARQQYRLWLLLLGLLAVPFLPLPFAGASRLWKLFFSIEWAAHRGLFETRTGGARTTGGLADTAGAALQDFALSASPQVCSFGGAVLFGIWIAGIAVSLTVTFGSLLRLRRLHRSSLPLQHPQARLLYLRCLKKAGISRNIPVYSSAFLKSPMIAGVLSPRIYLPVHLLSDYREKELSYMLLHELEHYKHGDVWTGILMNLAWTLYWFHPLVRYALGEMRDHREAACDASVLDMLEEGAYLEYGYTLINFAEETASPSLPFTAGLGSGVRQLKRRILSIASYEKPGFRKKASGTAAFLLAAALLTGSIPLLSTHGADQERYHWNRSEEAVSPVDLSSCFGAYEGSFVLYDLMEDTWKIYRENQALLRTSPNSTYKIYDALFALEDGLLTPEHSLMEWDGHLYPFAEWNRDQTLESALSHSVNWYFQRIDAQLGTTRIARRLRQIGYGNQDLSGDPASYWLESSLKISPVEQVELLTDLYCNRSGFAPENFQAVTASLLLSRQETGALYGKTGTGRINGQDVSGWFVGFLEGNGTVSLFAVNIRSDSNASGSQAARIALSALHTLHLLPDGFDTQLPIPPGSAGAYATPPLPDPSR